MRVSQEQLMTERFVWVNDKYCVNLDAIAYFQAKDNDGVAIVMRGTPAGASVIELSPKEGDDLLEALRSHGLTKYFVKAQIAVLADDMQQKIDRLAETHTAAEIKQLMGWIDGGMQGPPPFDVSEFFEANH